MAASFRGLCNRSRGIEVVGFDLMRFGKVASKGLPVVAFGMMLLDIELPSFGYCNV